MQLPQIISVASGDPLAFNVQRGGKDLVIWVAPKRLPTRDILGNNVNQMMIGVSPDPKAPETLESYGPVGAFQAACGETWNIIKTTVMGITRMVTGHGGTDQPSGPVGIAKMTRQVAAYRLLAAAQSGGYPFLWALGLPTFFRFRSSTGGIFCIMDAKRFWVVHSGSGPRTSGFGSGWFWCWD